MYADTVCVLNDRKCTRAHLVFSFNKISRGHCVFLTLDWNVLTRLRLPNSLQLVSMCTMSGLREVLPVLCPPFQAIDSIHQVGVYCLALVPANTLPKAPLGGVHISEAKQRFLEGTLHPCNVLMCPHTCVTNLPKPRQKQPG